MILKEKQNMVLEQSKLYADALKQVLADRHIEVEVKEQVAMVRFNRPKVRNAMSLNMWRAIPGIFKDLEADPQVRAIILCGADRDFCVGADIAEFSLVRKDVSQAKEYEEAVDACCDAIYTINKPTLAAIKGYCLGGAVHLAISCDFRFASKKAILGIPAAKLSIVYGVKGTRKLNSLVGITHAKRIFFTGEQFLAEKARDMGLIDHLCGLDSLTDESNKESGDTDEVMLAAFEFAKNLALSAPLSIIGAKTILNGLNSGMGDITFEAADEVIDQAASSQDYLEGRNAFIEKRQPRFTGK